MTSYGPTSMPILPGSYLPYLPPSVDEEHIYESLHNARWESMKKVSRLFILIFVANCLARNE